MAGVWRLEGYGAAEPTAVATLIKLTLTKPPFSFG
jgi:hypothetical protein